MTVLYKTHKTQLHFSPMCFNWNKSITGQQRRRLRVASGATAPDPALEGAPRFRPYEFVKLYSPVNWKCCYMLRLKSFFRVKLRCVVLGCLLYRNRLHIAPKGAIIISLLGQRHCRHVIISIKKPLSTNRKTFYE